LEYLENNFKNIEKLEEQEKTKDTYSDMRSFADP